MNYTTTKAKRFMLALAAALIVGFTSVSCSEDEVDKSGQGGGASVETDKREPLGAMEQAATTSTVQAPRVDGAGNAVASQNKTTALDRISEILALAKESADEDDNVDFWGFFVGMSRHDAAELAKWYKLNPFELNIRSVGENAVWCLEFSLKGIRRITKGGSTFEELAQAVANRVGDFKYNHEKERYEHKTIDGIVVSISETKGVAIINDNLKSKEPKETLAAKSERLATVQSILPGLVANMVTIPGKDYKMGKFEVTQLEWWRVMGNAPSYYNGAEAPVESVSFYDCQEFLTKLNEMPEVKASGLVFRLPTAEEWEYACRAGATGKYSKLADGTEVTEETLGAVSWCKGNSGAKTHPVGLKAPNAFGLYDMHGNVWEWTQTADGGRRDYCGGSWHYSAWYCGSSFRLSDSPFDRSNDLGFRLCASGRAD